MASSPPISASELRKILANSEEFRADTREQMAALVAAVTALQTHQAQQHPAVQPPQLPPLQPTRPNLTIQPSPPSRPSRRAPNRPEQRRTDPPDASFSSSDLQQHHRYPNPSAAADFPLLLALPARGRPTARIHDPRRSFSTAAFPQPRYTDPPPAPYSSYHNPVFLPTDDLLNPTAFSDQLPADPPPLNPFLAEDATTSSATSDLHHQPWPLVPPARSRPPSPSPRHPGGRHRAPPPSAHRHYFQSPKQSVPPDHHTDW